MTTKQPTKLGQSIKRTVWWAVSVSVFGAAVLFPDNEAVSSLAIVYAWLMIACGLFGVLLLVAIYGATLSDNPDISSKAEQGIEKMRETMQQNKALSWFRFFSCVALLALAAMPVTAICYAIASLIKRMANAILLSTSEDN